jgi:transposase
MSNLFWLSDAQIALIEPFVPKSHGKPRVDDKRVLSGIIFINRNGLRWRDAPSEYGPVKTIYNRWERWSDKGVFARMLLELADQGNETDTLMIDAIRLKTHRTASSLGLQMDLSRFDAAPLIAFIATKETDYGTEANRRIQARCGADCVDQWSDA